jgi:uncharacterized membrane protein
MGRALHHYVAPNVFQIYFIISCGVTKYMCSSRRERGTERKREREREEERGEERSVFQPGPINPQ